MFPESSTFNSNSSASSVANPASVLSDPIAESALFQTLFAMPAINTINQDFCLFDVTDDSFDYPLFNGSNAASAKTLKTAQVNNTTAFNFISNPLCTPQTPSLDLVTPSAVPTTDGLGFDSCSAFLEDSALSHNLIDTPFTPYLDTPSLIDTPLETPFLSEIGLDNFDMKVDSPFPLFNDMGLDFAPYIEPTMVFQQFNLNKSPNDLTLPSPALSILSDDDDSDFVASRSDALTFGLKRKTDDALSASKKVRVEEMPAAKKASAIKRFSCNQPGCDRRFARLFNLHTHEKTHDPEQARPFSCPEADCGKSFSRKHDLQRHEASVHKGERNFACANCHKPFSRQDGLRRHLAVKGPCSDNAWLAT